MARTGLVTILVVMMMVVILKVMMQSNGAAAEEVFRTEKKYAAPYPLYGVQMPRKIASSNTTTTTTTTTTPIPELTECPKDSVQTNQFFMYHNYPLTAKYILYNDYQSRIAFPVVCQEPGWELPLGQRFIAPGTNLVIRSYYVPDGDDPLKSQGLSGRVDITALSLNQGKLSAELGLKVFPTPVTRIALTSSNDPFIGLSQSVTPAGSRSLVATWLKLGVPAHVMDLTYDQCGWLGKCQAIAVCAVEDVKDEYGCFNAGGNLSEQSGSDKIVEWLNTNFDLYGRWNVLAGAFVHEAI